MSRENRDNLLSACIPFAQQMLTKHGTFFPFGCTMTPTGEINLAASYDDKPDIGASEIAELLLEGSELGLDRESTKQSHYALMFTSMLRTAQGKRTRFV